MALSASLLKNAPTCLSPGTSKLASLRRPPAGLSSPHPRHSPRKCGHLHVSARIPEEGMYGGPPDRRFRRTWGGEKKQDPLETGDYLWDNREDWKRVLDKELKEASSSPSSSSTAVQRGSGSENQGSGFLSLGRSMALDSLDMDLSRELIPTRTVSLEDQVEAARLAAGERLLGRPSPSEAGKEGKEGEGGIKWRAVNTPSGRESRQRDKGQTFSFKAGGYFKEVTPETQEEEEARFQKLKNRLVMYTLGLGTCFSASAALVYSPEIATSFALGTVGSLVYVRMLSSTVESLGKSGLENAARGSVGQPRLLVPVVLVMTFNRWNAILVPEYGLAELQLIPMLLGFLTYKAATIVQTFQDILSPEDATGEAAETTPSQESKL